MARPLSKMERAGLTCPLADCQPENRNCPQRVMERAETNVTSKIRAARKKRGISQRDLARTLGMAQSTLSRLERGERRVSVDQLIEIARALGVRPADMLD